MRSNHTAGSRARELRSPDPPSPRGSPGPAGLEIKIWSPDSLFGVLPHPTLQHQNASKTHDEVPDPVRRIQKNAVRWMGIRLGIPYQEWLSNRLQPWQKLPKPHSTPDFNTASQQARSEFSLGTSG